MYLSIRLICLSIYLGCGGHIEMALNGVPIANRCKNWKSGSACDGAKPLNEAIMAVLGNAKLTSLEERVAAANRVLDEHGIVDREERAKWIDAVENY